MTSDLLTRLLALSKKTGDRLVVIEEGNAVVLLPIEHYEELVNGQSFSAFSPVSTDESRSFQHVPEDPLEVVNREMAAIRETPTVREPDSLVDRMQAEGDLGEEQFYLEPVE